VVLSENVRLNANYRLKFHFLREKIKFGRFVAKTNLETCSIPFRIKCIWMPISQYQLWEKAPF